MMFRGMFVTALVAATWSITARAETDYTQLPRCIGPNGSGDIFARYAGRVQEAGGEKIVSFQPGPGQTYAGLISPATVRVDLTAGKGTKADVTVYALRRPSKGSKVVLGNPVKTKGGVFDLQLSGDATYLIDGYWFEFKPSKGVSESCVFAFSDAWRWQYQRERDTSVAVDGTCYDLENPPKRPKSPIEPQCSRFTPGELSSAAPNQALYGGTSGLGLTQAQPIPQQLWVQRSAAPAALLRDGHGDAPEWNQINWDGRADQLIGNTEDATSYHVWLCSSWPTASGNDTCVMLVDYRLATDPLLVRTKSSRGATIEQSIALQSFLPEEKHFAGAQDHSLTVFSLRGGVSDPATTNYNYRAFAGTTLPKELTGFVKSLRKQDYAVALYGNADFESVGGRCPAQVKALPDRLHIFREGITADAPHVIACMYMRDDENGPWKLMADVPADGTPERAFTSLLDLQICQPQRACIPMRGGPGSLVVASRFSNFDTSLELRATQTNPAPKGLSIVGGTATLGSFNVRYPARLPDTAITDTSANTMTFTRFTREEWANERRAVCIDVGTSASSDENVAALRLLTGDEITTIGAGSWKKERVGDRNLLCPELSDDDVGQLLTALRPAVLSGQNAALFVVQGGRLVGQQVVIGGPERASVTEFEVHPPNDMNTTIDTFRRNEPLPEIGTLCALTTNDWGDRIFLDPSTITLRNEAGDLLASFTSRAPRSRVHPFVRPQDAFAKASANVWRYCTPVGEQIAQGREALEIRRETTPTPDTAQATWKIADASGCEDTRGEKNKPCGGELKADPVSHTILVDALRQAHVGILWGWHVGYLAYNSVPATEVRAYGALPLFHLDRSLWPRIVTASVDAGGMLGVSGARGRTSDVFRTRFALPISGYVQGCVSLTVTRRFAGLSPQLCGGAALDLLSFQWTTAGERAATNFSVNPPLLTPYVALSLGEF